MSRPTALVGSLIKVRVDGVLVGADSQSVQMPDKGLDLVDIFYKDLGVPTIGLSDRVLVMSASPGQLVDEIKIDLPRPRPVRVGEDASFARYADRIHETFRKLGVLRY